MREIYVAWHRPGGSSLEVLLEGEGKTEFLMAPWEGSLEAEPLILRGRVEEKPLKSDKTALSGFDFSVQGGTKKDDHISLITVAKEAISRGEFSKVVLSRTLDIHTGEIDLEAIVQAHAALHPNSFSWAVCHPHVGVWFGSTPEILLQGEDSTFCTVSLAGTRILGSGESNWHEKDRLEQQIVTDGMLESLARCGAQRLTVSDVATVQVGDLEHLRSEVQFEASCAVKDLVSALHPTPAVGGYPRKKALDFIAREEPHDRQHYTGLVGLRENGGIQTSLYVNLRCARYENGVTTAFAGGGITAGSNPESEWDETELKARSVLKAVQLLSTSKAS